MKVFHKIPVFFKGWLPLLGRLGHDPILNQISLLKASLELNIPCRLCSSCQSENQRRPPCKLPGAAGAAAAASAWRVGLDWLRLQYITRALAGPPRLSRCPLSTSSLARNVRNTIGKLREINCFGRKKYSLISTIHCQAPDRRDPPRL